MESPCPPQDIIDRIWNKASVIDGLDSNVFRKDSCGAAMMKNKFGDTSSPFGWTIDHIYPRSKGGDDNEVNLRAMQWQNNVSKGHDFPLYNSAVVFDSIENVPSVREFRVNSKKLEELSKIYSIEL